MPPSEAYLIPPLIHSHILFTIPSPDASPHAYSHAPLTDYNYSTRQALLLPAPYPASQPTMQSNKHVHWEDESRRTPSPAFSVSSQQSSAGPWTPPDGTRSLPQVVGQHSAPHYGQFLTPHKPHPKTQPLPSSPSLSASSSSSGGSPLPLVVNDLISTSLHKHIQTRPFQWDLLSDPVRLATPSDPRASPVMEYILQPAQLAAPATTPPVVDVKVMHPHLPWVITISASRYYGNIFATVGDVLQQLYQALRLNVSQLEFDTTVRINPSFAPRIQGAFERRMQKAGSYGADERRKGLRRVDLLMGETQFAGFKVVKGKDGEPMLLLHVR